MQNRKVVVLDSIAATAGDIAVAGRVLTITGCPAITYPDITQVTGPQMSLVATPYAALISFSAVNNQTYIFTITQNTFTTDNLIQNETITYTSDSSATLAEIRDAIINMVNKKINLKITASASGNNVLLTAQTGYELFTATNVQNITVASNMLQSVTIASNTTAAQTEFTTSAPHGLVVGQVITITTSDVTKFVAGTYRIANVSAATKFKLASVDGQTVLAGTATATGNITLVAQYAFGTYATVNADAGAVVATAGNTYTRIVFDYNMQVTPSHALKESLAENELVLYANEGDADYANFITRINEVIAGYAAATTNADPKLIAAR